METILLVDDEPDVCELARDCLVAAGYNVLQAGNGAEALRIAEAYTEPIHLLLTDVVMPGMSGHALATELRRQRRDVSVLYMSGFALTRAQHEALGMDAELEPGTPILPKPFSAEGLTRKVVEVLASRQPSRSPFARKKAGPREHRSDPWGPCAGAGREGSSL